ncbi:MAG TPA: Ig-like domain-containing protein, partial [Aquella sp.]|nr:Ig-like domain-containing protein [Aquella sp.]
MKNALKLYLGIIFSITILMITGCSGGGGGGTSLTPLSVSMSIPVNNATNTSTTPIIQLTFNSAMNVQSINTTTVQLIGPNNTVISIGAYISAAGNTIFTFAPNTILTANTGYSVVISTGATATNGLTLISAATFNFTTGSTATPIAQLTRPLAAGVTPAIAIEILFSKLMSIPTITTSNIQLIGPNGSVPIGTIIPGVVSGFLTTLAFAPLAPLAANTKYTIQLSSNIQDTSGISLAPTSFTFTTGSAITPSLQLVRPADNSQSISRANGFQVFFSESMNVAT